MAHVTHPHALAHAALALALLLPTTRSLAQTATTPAPAVAASAAAATAPTADGVTPHAALSAQARAIVPALSAEQSAQLPPETQQLIAKGRMVAIAADCAACHTVPGQGKPFAGGYVLGTPLGSIVATNITPSRQHGIGDYSEQEFSRAVRDGVRKDGRQLYPAMPYDAYAGITDEDLHALYTYMLQAVPAVDAPTPETQLPFPFNQRWSMLVWKGLYLKKGPYQPDAAQSAEWNRGAYLTQVLAHCTSCHTPRTMLMGEDAKQPLAGAYVGPWYAPNISSSPAAGIGNWSEAELVQYMQTGHAPGKGQAAGGMAEAVQNSLQFLPESDLKAIAVYLKATPPIEGNSANAKGTDPRGSAHSDEAQLRGITPFNHPEPVVGGRELFSAYCASCHQANGAGTPDQAYPSLFNNSATGRPNPSNLLATILFGVERDAAGKDVLMPRFDAKSYVDPLTDDQIAAIANHVLSNYGNGVADVTPAQVARVRSGNAGPTPLLSTLQPWIVPGMVLAALLLFALVLRWLRRRRT